MNDLISRSALLNHLVEKKIEKTAKGDMSAGVRLTVAIIEFLIELVGLFPAVDAVEVVRCKDCKFYETGVEYYGGGTKDVCRFLKRQTQEDDFCSYGERRADDATD